MEALFNDLIGRVGDKGTMIILEVLGEDCERRFTQIPHMVGGVRQEMLTQSLREIESEGMATRTPVS